MFFHQQAGELLERLRKTYLVGSTIFHRNEVGSLTEMTWVDGRFRTRAELIAMDRQDHEAAEPSLHVMQER